jgi:hypothetical protein
MNAHHRRATTALPDLVRVAMPEIPWDGQPSRPRTPTACLARRHSAVLRAQGLSRRILGEGQGWPKLLAFANDAGLWFPSYQSWGFHKANDHVIGAQPSTRSSYLLAPRSTARWLTPRLPVAPDLIAAGLRRSRPRGAASGNARMAAMTSRPARLLDLKALYRALRSAAAGPWSRTIGVESVASPATATMPAMLGLQPGFAERTSARALAACHPWFAAEPRERSCGPRAVAR